MYILNASYFTYIYPHIFFTYWILLDLNANYTCILYSCFTPIGWFSYLEEGSQIPETRNQVVPPGVKKTMNDHLKGGTDQRLFAVVTLKGRLRSVHVATLCHLTCNVITLHAC